MLLASFHQIARCAESVFPPIQFHEYMLLEEEHRSLDDSRHQTTVQTIQRSNIMTSCPKQAELAVSLGTTMSR